MIRRSVLFSMRLFCMGENNSFCISVKICLFGKNEKPVILFKGGQLSTVMSIAEHLLSAVSTLFGVHLRVHCARNLLQKILLKYINIIFGQFRRKLS